ncbi:hypothetical protein GCM10007977_017200 [Dactylosporangium sucinum]|uniref:Uncharacterized protein n=1 Tax=Dactylosporangium sucinum TaxID=1424081 RepID=A0A917TDD3_9ACTN|nr:hypothetical protein GCM10007977_017200 [Dactylosporangium sucinum]
MLAIGNLAAHHAPSQPSSDDGVALPVAVPEMRSPSPINFGAVPAAPQPMLDVGGAGSTPVKPRKAKAPRVTESVARTAAVASPAAPVVQAEAPAETPAETPSQSAAPAGTQRADRGDQDRRDRDPWRGFHRRWWHQWPPAAE